MAVVPGAGAGRRCGCWWWVPGAGAGAGAVSWLRTWWRQVYLRTSKDDLHVMHC